MVTSGHDRRRQSTESQPTDEVDWVHLFSGAPVALTITDVHGRYVDANDAFTQLLGYERAELLELNHDDITEPDDLVWTRELIKQVAAADLPAFRGSRTFRRKNGSTINCRLLARDYTPSSLTLWAVIPDAATQDRDVDRNSALLALSSETITMVDTQGRLLAVEGFSRPVLGYPAAFWKDHTILDIVDPAERSRLFLMGERVTQIPGSEVDTEVEVAAADGTTRTMTARVINCLDNPAIGALVLITRDVTRYRLALDELQRRSGLAEQIADAQTRLLATVSHELRNPLHAVRGMAELLAAELLPQHAVDLANSLVRQLDALAGVTNDLLDAAQIEVVPADVRRSSAALREVVGDAVDLCRTQVRDRPITVVCVIDDSVPEEVLIDARRLRQIIANLLGNAAKFTVAGTIEITVESKKNELLVAVRDTGVGIPENELDAVLEPFRCGSTAGASRGAGLGLSIVSRMVTAMGGTMELASEVGVGTRFDLRIPYAPAPPKVEFVAPPPTRELTGTRVLVVEDSVVNQQLARAQLERLGMTAYIVSSGEQAIEALNADPELFDVVILDEQLPGMSGTETVGAVRALSGIGENIPVVGMSASTSQSDRERFIEAGMNDFIAKPASLVDIERTISSVLDGGAPHHAPVAVPQGGVTQHTPVAVLDAGALSAWETEFDSEASSDTPTDTLADTLADTLTDTSGGHGHVTRAPRSLDGVLDGSVLNQLTEEIGGEGTESLLQTFLAELPQRTETLVGSLRTDPEVCKRMAHTLRSSSRLFGLAPLANLCEKIEKQLADAELPSVEADFECAVSDADLACRNWLTDRKN